MNKLSSPSFRGIAVLLSLAMIALCLMPPVTGYAKEYGPSKEFQPDGGGQEYYGSESIRGGYQGGAEDRGSGIISNWSPAELLLHLFLICQSLGLSL